jgi:DNA-binding NarL/FixJ family response regulator
VPDTIPTKAPLRVAIADDHRLMLDGIKRALETAPDIKVVAEATTGEEMLSIVPRVRPDVVILDLRMPKGDGLSTLAALRKDYPDLKIIILSMSEANEHIDQAFHGGASGYVAKTINPLDLPSTIRQVVERLSNLDIASKLYVTEQTVKFHLSNIYRKLGVGNRTEATRYAYRNGLIE